MWYISGITKRSSLKVPKRLLRRVGPETHPRPKRGTRVKIGILKRLLGGVMTVNSLDTEVEIQHAPKSPPQSSGLANVEMGLLMCPCQAREHTEATLVSVGGEDIATLAILRPSLERYRQRPNINGAEVEALMDIGANVTMGDPQTGSPSQIIPDETFQVTNSDNKTKA